MFSDDQQRKILLLGPSGSGKSSLCNAILSGKIDIQSLQKPAKVAASAAGCTANIQHYVGDNTLVVTDTIGFDDNRFEPEKIAKELRRIIKVAGIGYAKIILCLRYGRVSEPSRVYLRLLDTIFERPEKHMLLYVGHCEDGTTADEFVEENMEDEDIGSLLVKLQNQQSIFDNNAIAITNIITGSMVVHRKAELDKNIYAQTRKDTLHKVMRNIDIDIGVIKARTDVWERVNDFVIWLVRAVAVTVGALSVIKAAVATAMSSEIIEIKYNYGECAICLEDDFDISWAIIPCFHKFHVRCIDQLAVDEREGLRECPCCRKKFKLGEPEELPRSMSSASH